MGEEILSMELSVNPVIKWLRDSDMENQSNDKTLHVPKRDILEKGKIIPGHTSNQSLKDQEVIPV